MVGLSATFSSDNNVVGQTMSNTNVLYKFRTLKCGRFVDLPAAACLDFEKGNKYFLSQLREFQ